MRLRLEDAPFAGRTGRGVVVAVIDSGIHAAHPHVGGVLGGANLLHDEELQDELHNLRITERRLSRRTAALLAQVVRPDEQ